MPEQKNTFCRICEPACPLKASINDHGKVTHLAPNPSHPSGGIPCHKGLHFLDVHNSPDRLNWPLKRQNKRSESKGEFTRVSWDDAFNEIGIKLRELREKYGPNSIAFFTGNPGVFDSRAFISMMPFIMQTGTKMLFNAGTQDMTNKFRGAYDLYGTRSLPIPDLHNTNYFLCLGANPKISHWTLVAHANDSLNVLKEVKKRGGKCVFVNPRKIESSMPETGQTLLIKPGTDVYFLAAVINEIANNNDLNLEHIAKYGKNLDGLLDFVKQYPASTVTSVTCISETDIKQVAQDFVAADGAACFISTGVAQSGQGLLTHWLSEMLNFITANLGKKGGTFTPTGFFNNKIPCDVTKLPMFQTSIGELSTPPPGIALPSVILPDLIESGEVKALIVLAGNPILTVGGEDRMRQAFEKLELLVTTDIMLSATGELSDFALASCSWLERADINLVNNGLQSGTPSILYTDAMEQPNEDRKEDWWTVCRLAKELGIPNLLDQAEEAREDGFMPINRMIAGSDLTIDEIKKMPYQTAALDRIPYDDIYSSGVLHEDNKVECYPRSFETAGLIKRCAQMFEELQNEPPGTLKLGSLRTNQMHNSWLSNVQKLRKGTFERNPLHMCSEDAQARHLFDGDEVRVHNEHGTVVTVLKVDDNMRPGAVAMSHGYARTSNQSLKVASELRGANCNQLMPANAFSFEPLSNMSRLCAVNVEVSLLE